jgi:hypothetical protein
MKTQMNYQHGVNKKATTDTASCAEAEKGEAMKQQMEFKCNVTPAKGYKPKAGPQMNFPNGQ